MAVTRKKDFTINLGNLIEERLISFSETKAVLRAREEADFQRSVIDNDLSYSERLSYRETQLEEEGKKSYKDHAFMNEIKNSISVLKKQVKNQRFRDDYFSFLQSTASGHKTLKQQVEYLKTSLDYDYLDQETKSQLETAYTSSLSAQVQQEINIVDANIKFNTEDRTMKSINKAIDDVKDQLAKSTIIKNPELKASYELQLRSLQKDKIEIGIEDKAISMSVDMMSQTRPNDSVWKVNSFVNIRDTSSADVPITINDIRYDSAQEFWSSTLNDYIRNDFATDYSTENDKNMTAIFNKLGKLPDSALDNLVTLNNELRNNLEFADFQSVVDVATQNSISKAIELKANEIEKKYYLGAPELTTQSNIEGAQAELQKLQSRFGDFYSLSPYAQNLEALLLQKKTQLTGDILEKVKDVVLHPEDYGEAAGITYQEALAKYGPEAVVEVEPEEMVGKTPEEIAKTALEKGEEAKVKPEEIVEAEPIVEKEPEEVVEKEPVVEEEVPAKEVVEPQTHTVLKGETLWGISKKYLGSGRRWKELQSVAGEGFTEEAARKLQIGQQILIPNQEKKNAQI